MSATLKVGSIMFGVTDTPITKDNIHLPDNCIYWRVDQGPEDFATCVIVLDDGETNSLQEWYIKETKGEIYLEIKREDKSGKAGAWLAEENVGRPPLGRGVLAWLSDSMICGKSNFFEARGEWVSCSFRTKESSGVIYVYAHSKMLPVKYKSKDSITWVELPNQKTKIQ